MPVLSPDRPAPAAGRRPAGPRGNPLYGTIRDVRRNILDFVPKVAEEYGDLARVRLLPGWYGYLLFHPRHYGHVLVDGSGRYSKDVVHFDVLSLLIGQSVVTLNGAPWKRRRQLAQPGFHRQRIARFGEVMTDSTNDMLDRWETLDRATPVDIELEMTRLTLGVATRTLLSVEFTGELDEVGKAFIDANRFMAARWVNPFALWTVNMPTRPNRAFKRSLESLDEIVYKIIRERRRDGGSGPDDLLAMLLEARDEETGEGLTEPELRDEVMTIMIAGHETSSTALTWTWYLLSQNPHVQDKLATELDEVLGGRTPTVADLPKLKYTRMVFDEALRLYPPAYVIGRRATEDDEIDGFHIPKGAPVYLVPYVTHRHPEVWERPDEFDPDRFREVGPSARSKFAYIPFGAGPRFCMGASFALIEAQLILATVAQRYRMRLAPGARPEPMPLVTIRPRAGMPMLIEPA
jgi:cytochrome P450